MIINFLGDSITEQHCASCYEKCYVSLVGFKLGAQVNNYGISGTRIASKIVTDLVNDQNNYFALRVDKMDPNADYVFVFGGTNDFGHGSAPIGEINDTTVDTFYGAMNHLIETLLKKYKKNHLIFILPLHRTNEDNVYGDGFKEEPSLTLDGYVDVMKEVLNKHNIRILDIREQLLPCDDNSLFYDGLHPNDNGHELIANLIVEYIKKELM